MPRIGGALCLLFAINAAAISGVIEACGPAVARRTPIRPDPFPGSADAIALPSAQPHSIAGQSACSAAVGCQQNNAEANCRPRGHRAVTCLLLELASDFVGR